MIKLIFINLNGIIISEKGIPILRNGVFEFLERYKSKQIAILSYLSKDDSIKILNSIGILQYTKIIYTEESMSHVRIYNKERNDLKDYYPQPILKAWAQVDFKTKLENTIVISNNVWDKLSTNWYDTRLIETPPLDNNITFSFEKICIDSLHNELIYFKQRLQRKQQIISYK